MTYGERFQQIEKAIQQLETGNIASYKIGEQVITRLNIKVLYAERKYLLRQIEENGADFDPLTPRERFNGKARIVFG